MQVWWQEAVLRHKSQTDQIHIKQKVNNLVPINVRKVPQLLAK